MHALTYGDIIIVYDCLLQLEQEICLIVERTDMFTRAVNDWNTKWVPAILQYSLTLSGKKATTVLSVQKQFEGEQLNPSHGPIKNSVLLLCLILTCIQSWRLPAKLKMTNEIM